MVDTTVTTLLVLAGGAEWETGALETCGAAPQVVVHKRCIDLPDLLASATLGQASVAVVAADAHGLDRTAVEHLHRCGVAVVAVVPPHWRDDQVEQLRRGGVAQLLAAADVARIPQVVRGIGAPSAPSPAGADAPVTAPGTGRVVAVWGPAGSPGRTTVALGLAAAWAGSGLDPLLLDLDPWGGTVAQHLGIVEDVSGLLACNRHHVAGSLAPSYVALQRRAAGFRVVTGLPRADRWPEVRPEAVEEMVALGRRQGPVVLDTGFALEHDAGADWSGRPGRNELTRLALEAADDVVVVGSADPVGLARLVRGLTELREEQLAGPVHVVVNRMRRGLGWAEADLAAMVAGGGQDVRGVHFLPDDRGSVDRALVTGRTVAEVGDNPLSRALADLAGAVLPTSTGRVSRRRAGRARPR